jgi:hypothetical protein
MILDDLIAIGEAGMGAAKMMGIGKKKIEEIIVGQGVIGIGGIVTIEEIQIGEMIIAVGIITGEMT